MGSHGWATALTGRLPTSWREAEIEQFCRGPNMIGQTSCNSWRTLNPTVPETADGQLETQALVRATEIVPAANHIPTFRTLNSHQVTFLHLRAE